MASQGSDLDCPALVKIIGWCRTGDKALFEPMVNQITDAYMRHLALMLDDAYITNDGYFTDTYMRHPASMSSFSINNFGQKFERRTWRISLNEYLKCQYTYPRQPYCLISCHILPAVVTSKNPLTILSLELPGDFGQQYAWTQITQASTHCIHLGAVSIRKTVLPGMVIPMLKIRRPNGRLIFNMEIAIRR